MSKKKERKKEKCGIKGENEKFILVRIIVNRQPQAVSFRRISSQRGKPLAQIGEVSVDLLDSPGLLFIFQGRTCGSDSLF